jgi:hypothetical protein
MQNHGDYSTIGGFSYREMEMRQKDASKEGDNYNCCESPVYTNI